VRTFAIGDIHGCNSALLAVLDAVQPQPADVLVFLGDYIDRGASSRDVIETLLKLPGRCKPVFLRGNHEVMIMEARDDFQKSDLWQSYGGLETIYSYNGRYQEDWSSSIPESHWRFFEQTRRFHETADRIFVHACVDAELEMSEQPDWLLFWEFFDRIQPHKSGKRVICGHTPQQSGEINNQDYAICIDTGIVYGRWLTCLETTSGEYWQSNERGTIRTGRILK
jgi:serine/threonine protein phosphatase 1